MISSIHFLSAGSIRSFIFFSFVFVLCLLGADDGARDRKKSLPLDFAPVHDLAACLPRNVGPRDGRTNVTSDWQHVPTLRS